MNDLSDMSDTSAYEQDSDEEMSDIFRLKTFCFRSASKHENMFKVIHKISFIKEQ